jgi:hypothetical protein
VFLIFSEIQYIFGSNRLCCDWGGSFLRLRPRLARPEQKHPQNRYPQNHYSTNSNPKFKPYSSIFVEQIIVSL